MLYNYKIIKLIRKFFEDYPSESYPEILNKENRAYNCTYYFINRV